MPTMTADQAATVPQRPTDLTKADLAAALKGMLVQAKADDVASLAAGVAFKIFLSIFPALLALAAFFALLTEPGDLGRTLGALEDFELVPPDALSLIRDPLAELVTGGGASAGGVAVVGVLLGLWAASSAAVTLIKALNRAFGVAHPRPFVAQRLVSLLLTAALLLTILGVFLLVVMGTAVQEALLPARLAGGFPGAVVAALRLLAAVVLLVALFAFVYWMAPNRSPPAWRWMSPGAIVGVVGWLVLSGLFTLYVRNFGNYDATYGTLGAVVVLMLWLQLSMAVLLLGAELNAELEQRRVQSSPSSADSPSGSV